MKIHCKLWQIGVEWREGMRGVCLGACTHVKHWYSQCPWFPSRCKQEAHKGRKLFLGLVAWTTLFSNKNNLSLISPYSQKGINGLDLRIYSLNLSATFDNYMVGISSTRFFTLLKSLKVIRTWLELQHLINSSILPLGASVSSYVKWAWRVIHSQHQGCFIIATSVT